MKCQTCRKNDAELLTRWEKIRFWLFIRLNSAIFPTDFEDLKSEKYTQGVSDGFQDGVEREKQNSLKLWDTMQVKTPPTQEDIEIAMMRLLSPIDTNKILTITASGMVYIGGEKATEGQLANLKQEAEAMEQFDLWHILMETPKKLAQNALFKEGDNIETMRKGRTMLYTLDTQQRFIDILKRVKTPLSPPEA